MLSWAAGGQSCSHLTLPGRSSVVCLVGVTRGHRVGTILQGAIAVVDSRWPDTSMLVASPGRLPACAGAFQAATGTCHTLCQLYIIRLCLPSISERLQCNGYFLTLPTMLKGDQGVSGSFVYQVFVSCAPVLLTHMCPCTSVYGDHLTSRCFRVTGGLRPRQCRWVASGL